MSRWFDSTVPFIFMEEAQTRSKDIIFPKKDKWDSEEGQTHNVETDKCYCSDFNPKCEHCMVLHSPENCPKKETSCNHDYKAEGHSECQVCKKETSLREKRKDWFEHAKAFGWSLDSFNNRVEELEREAVLRLKHELDCYHYTKDVDCRKRNLNKIDEIFGDKLT